MMIFFLHIFYFQTTIILSKNVGLCCVCIVLVHLAKQCPKLNDMFQLNRGYYWRQDYRNYWYRLLQNDQPNCKKRMRAKQKMLKIILMFGKRSWMFFTRLIRALVQFDDWSLSAERKLDLHLTMNCCYSMKMQKLDASNGAINHSVRKMETII